MDIYRSTRERLYKDESLFNNLLPYVKWDEERQVFIHADASLWSIWELKPIVLSTISTQEAFQITSQIQEILDSFDHTISVQFNWVTTFDVEDILQKNIKEYPLDGVAGFMARRWVKMLKNMSKSYRYGTRTKKQRLYVAFRYDAPWVEKGLMAIQFYLDMIEQKKPELENCQTAYMSCSEVEEWEKKNAAASVSFDSGGVVEFLPIEMFSKDAKIEKGGGIKGMLISMCDCACEDEISEIVSSNDEIRKLRDALNKYLES